MSPTVCLILWTTAVVSNSILVVRFAFFPAARLPFCAGWQLSNADVIHWQIAKAYRFETNRGKKWEFELKNGYLCCEMAVVLLLCDHQSKYQPLFDFCCFCRTFNLYSRLWSDGLFFLPWPFKPNGQSTREWHLWKLNCTIGTAESRLWFYTRHLKTWCWIFRMEGRLFRTEELFVIIFKTWTFQFTTLLCLLSRPTSIPELVFFGAFEAVSQHERRINSLQKPSPHSRSLAENAQSNARNELCLFFFIAVDVDNSQHKEKWKCVKKRKYNIITPTPDELKATKERSTMCVDNNIHNSEKETSENNYYFRFNWTQTCVSVR